MKWKCLNLIKTTTTTTKWPKKKRKKTIFQMKNFRDNIFIHFIFLFLISSKIKTGSKYQFTSDDFHNLVVFCFCFVFCSKCMYVSIILVATRIKIHCAILADFLFFIFYFGFKCHIVRFWHCCSMKFYVSPERHT